MEVLQVGLTQLSGSDEGFGAEMWRPPTPPTTHALRLQQLLEISGDQWDPRDMDVLRQQVMFGIPVVLKRLSTFHALDLLGLFLCLLLLPRIIFFNLT